MGKGSLERARVGVKIRVRKFYFGAGPLTRAPGVSKYLHSHKIRFFEGL